MKLFLGHPELFLKILLPHTVKGLVTGIWERTPSNFSIFHSQIVPHIWENRREKNLALIFSSITFTIQR